MIRNIIRTVWILLAALGISIPLIAVSLPANATSNFVICELFGNFCAGAPTLSSGNLVTDTPSGRLVISIKQTTAFEGHDTYRIEFNANKNLCLGSSDGVNVTVQPCGNGIGVVWALVHPDGANGQDEWINRASSQQFNVDMYLSSHNKNGSFYFLTTLGFNGAFQKYFEFVN